jgi:hypothetical protein
MDQFVKTLHISGEDYSKDAPRSLIPGITASLEKKNITHHKDGTLTIQDLDQLKKDLFENSGFKIEIVSSSIDTDEHATLLEKFSLPISTNDHHDLTSHIISIIDCEKKLQKVFIQMNESFTNLSAKSHMFEEISLMLLCKCYLNQKKGKKRYSKLTTLRETAFMKNFTNDEKEILAFLKSLSTYLFTDAKEFVFESTRTSTQRAKKAA